MEDKVEVTRVELTFHPMIARLGAGQFLRIEEGNGKTVAVFDGLVWVTQHGDPRDAFVARGESFMLDRPGLAIVEAMTEARVALLASAPEHREEDEPALA